MFKVNRLTGYSVMLLSTMLKSGKDDKNAMFTASGLSKTTKLPQATVIKILKQLTTSKYIKSRRGIKGGYYLEPGTENISFAHLIESMEGPINISDCDAGKPCYIKDNCPIRPVCDGVNREIRVALDKIKIKDMASGMK